MQKKLYLKGWGGGGGGGAVTQLYLNNNGGLCLYVINGQPDEGRLTWSKYRWETKNVLFYPSHVVLYLLSCEENVF